jgi:hypothetical protein
MRPFALVLIVTLLTGPPAAYAGQPAEKPDTKSQQARPAAPANARPVDLPVSLDRIRRKLAQTPPSKTTGLKLEYYVEVYGKSPRLDFLTEFDATSGAVQYGSPTHREFLDLVTPQEFKSPPADLLTPTLALMKWLAEKASKSKSKSDPQR